MNSLGNDLYNVAVSDSHLPCVELLLPVPSFQFTFRIMTFYVLYRALARTSVIMISLMQSTFTCRIKYNTNLWLDSTLSLNLRSVSIVFILSSIRSIVFLFLALSLNALLTLFWVRTFVPVSSMQSYIYGNFVFDITLQLSVNPYYHLH